MPKTKLKRLGGKTFPRHDVRWAAQRAELLCQKTHKGPISIDELSTAVLGASKVSFDTKVKAAALKAYGLVEGTYAGYRATELARNIAQADEGQRQTAYCEMLLSFRLFEDAWDNFSGQETTKSKVASYAASSLGVHTENKDKFAEVFVASAEAAGLCTLEGETVRFQPGTAADHSLDASEGESAQDVEPEALQAVTQEPGVVVPGGTEDPSASVERRTADLGEAGRALGATTRTSAPLNVTISIDDHMSPETLAKYLELLRHYGII
jgi:hypothetical protein